MRGRELRQGKRRRREYEVTALGLVELRAWIGPPLGEEALTVSFDPLRTRARFLSALDGPDRRAWVDAASRLLDQVEVQVRAWAEANPSDDPFLRAITRHGLLETEARRRWLEELRTLTEPLSGR